MKTAKGLPERFASRVVRGWVVIARVIASLGAGIVLAGLLGGVVVLPLWLLASRATDAYNLLVGVLALGLLVFGLVRFLRRQTSGSLLPILRKTGVILVGLGGVYAFAILVWEGYGWAAILLAVLYLVWIGAAFGRRRSSSS